MTSSPELAVRRKTFEAQLASRWGGDLGCKLPKEDFATVVGSDSAFFQDRLFALINKGGTVSFSDFLELILQYTCGSEKTKTNLLFRLYDVNNDGVLSREEMEVMIGFNLMENGLNPEEELVADELVTILLQKAFDNRNMMLGMDDFHRLFDGHEELLHKSEIGLDWLGTSSLPSQKKPYKKIKRYTKWVGNNPILFFWVQFYWASNVVLLASSVIYLVNYKNTRFWLAAGVATGYCIALNTCLMLVTMMRHLMARLKSTWLVHWIPFDDHQYFHELGGKVLGVFSICHMVVHLVNLRIAVNGQDRWTYVDNLFIMEVTNRLGLLKGFAYLGGLILFAVLMLIIIFALSSVRKSGCFKAFYITHILGYPVYLTLAILHSRNFWKWIVVPLFLFVVEQIFRIYYSYISNTTTIVSAEIMYHCVTKLVLKRPRNLIFRPGDYVFIKIPHFSRYEWHPFTISSPPENVEELTLHIRAHGPWTQKLYDFFNSGNRLNQNNANVGNGVSLGSGYHNPVFLDVDQNSNSISDSLKPSILPSGAAGEGMDKRNVGENPAPRGKESESIETIQVYMDGPYRTPSGSIFLADHAVLIAGGIGITPFASILESVMLRRKTMGLNKSDNSSCHEDPELGKEEGRSKLRKLRKVDFIWINRGHNSFQWFPDLLDELQSEEEKFGRTSGRFLNINLYNTKALSRNDLKSVVLQLAFDLYFQKTNRDFLSKSKSPVTLGRPDWEEIFSNFVQTNRGNITIFYCGPPTLGKKIKRMCIRYGFIFKKDNF